MPLTAGGMRDSLFGVESVSKKNPQQVSLRMIIFNKLVFVNTFVNRLGLMAAFLHLESVFFKTIYLFARKFSDIEDDLMVDRYRSSIFLQIYLS